MRNHPINNAPVNADLAPVVATRQTFDGVTLYFHKDGTVSTRMATVTRCKIKQAALWNVADDVCLYTFAEVPALIRQYRVKGGGV